MTKQVLPRRSFGPTLPLNFLIDWPGVTGGRQIPTVANQRPTAVEGMAALTEPERRRQGF